MKICVEFVASLVAGLMASLAGIGVCMFWSDVKVPYLVPYTMNIPSSSPRLLASPLWNNLLLLLGFALQHSWTIRGPIDFLLKSLLSKENCRVLYVASSALYLYLIMICWGPMPYPLWDIQQEALKLIIHVAELMCVLCLAFSAVWLGLLNLLGIQSHLDKLFDRQEKKIEFVTTGFQGLVRHPIYTFFMLSMWITPKMTVGRLLVAVIFSAYMWIATVYYEEPQLVKDIGQKYQQYMKTTPRFIPDFRLSKTPVKVG